MRNSARHGRSVRADASIEATTGATSSGWTASNTARASSAAVPGGQPAERLDPPGAVGKADRPVGRTAERMQHGRRDFGDGGQALLLGQQGLLRQLTLGDVLGDADHARRRPQRAVRQVAGVVVQRTAPSGRRMRYARSKA